MSTLPTRDRENREMYALERDSVTNALTTKVPESPNCPSTSKLENGKCV